MQRMIEPEFNIVTEGTSRSRTTDRGCVHFDITYTYTRQTDAGVRT
jgi:hypothetical protein